MKHFISSFIANNNNNNNTSTNIYNNSYNNDNDDNYFRNLISKDVEQHQQQQSSFFQHELDQHDHMMQSSIHMNHYMGEGNNNKEISSGSTTLTRAYDIGDIDQALFLYLDNQNDHGPQNNNSSSSSAGEGEEGMKPPTPNIFPSQPMHIEPLPYKGSFGSGEGCGQVMMNSGLKRALERPSAMMLSNDIIKKRNKNHTVAPDGPSKSSKREQIHKYLIRSSGQEPRKKPDPKTLRRLAQNREAARKSRLKKKVYVHQLESSRVRLAQLEHELQRAGARGIYYGGAGDSCENHGIPVGVNNISPDAAVFDTEYTMWLEEHHRLSCLLRAALQEHVPENELKMYVDNCLAHYDLVMTLNSRVAKTDVFHLVSGLWKTPAERCFLWLGGFRPSELIKIIIHPIEPLTEDQLINICGLQQTTHEAEEALSQGLQMMHQNLSDVISSDPLTGPPNMNNVGLMALAMNRLSTMENFVRQADSLRHQTLYRLHHILTTRQAARCFVAIAEYSHRLRALSSLWMSTPRQE